MLIITPNIVSQIELRSLRLGFNVKIWCFTLECLIQICFCGPKSARNDVLPKGVDAPEFLRKTRLGRYLISNFCCSFTFMGKTCSVTATCFFYSGWCFSDQHATRVWSITWSTSSSRPEIYICCVMSNLWATETAKETRGYWYRTFVAKVCIIFFPPIICICL